MIGDAQLHLGGVGEDVGKLAGAEGRLVKAERSLSSSEQMRLTSHFEIPEAIPRPATGSSTLRVETPWT